MLSQAIAFNLFLAFFPTLLLVVAIATSPIGSRTDMLNLVTDFTRYLPPGSRQVVSISAGTADGIDNGTTFTIMSQGEKIADEVSGNYLRRTTSRKAQLPDEFGGHLMVFKSFDHVSYALVMDALRPVRRGDKLVLPQ